MNTVSDLMTPNPIHAAPHTPLAVCAIAMHHGNFRHLPVTDDKGHLLGVLTDTALFSRGALSGSDPGFWVYFDPNDDAQTARELMSTPLVTAAPGDALLTTLQRLLDNHSSAAFVLEDDRLIGVLTEHDVLRLGRRVLSGLLSTRALSSRPVLSVDSSAPISVAWDLMLGSRLRHLLVTENGRLCMVISFRDLARTIGAGDAAVWDTPVHDLYARAWPIFLQEDLSLPLATGLMFDEKIGCLPFVQDDQRPYGVLTRTDVIRYLIRELKGLQGQAV